MRVRLELLAQPEDEAVDGARQRRVLIAPDQVQQLVSGDDMPGSLRQASQNLELPSHQLQGFVGMDTASSCPSSKSNY